MSHTSCVIINEKLLPSGSAPVSTLNPAFVTWQPLGRVLKARGNALPGVSGRGGVIQSPLDLKIEVLSDEALRQAFQDLSRTEGYSVHAYPLEALTSNYEAYSKALKLTRSADVRYLAVSCLLPGQSQGRTLLNAAYADESMRYLALDASTLGLATGYAYPDETYSLDVEDADGLRHPYLTCIGHFFRKEKGQKLSRFAQGALEAPDAITFITLDKSIAPTITEESFRMAAIWAPTDLLKALKVHQMSSGRMHDELIQFKKGLDQRFGNANNPAQ